MKTFELKSLVILEDHGETEIPLHDGLIINREDDDEQWIIEAYTVHSFLNYFQTIKESNQEIQVRVKISKESNEPAIFLTKIIGINEMDTKMNVLFKGAVLDDRISKLEGMLKSMIDRGLSGEGLLNEFKQQIRG